MQIRVLNFKPFDKGSLVGFFDLGYGGLTIKGCRLMDGNNGLWFSFPQVKAVEDGETTYYDQMYLTPLEREHVRKLILLDLQAQGHLKAPKPATRPKATRRTPEGEDISDYYTQGQPDDISF